MIDNLFNLLNLHCWEIDHSRDRRFFGDAPKQGMGHKALMIINGIVMVLKILFSILLGIVFIGHMDTALLITYLSHLLKHIPSTYRGVMVFSAPKAIHFWLCQCTRLEVTTSQTGHVFLSRGAQPTRGPCIIFEHPRVGPPSRDASWLGIFVSSD